MPVRLCSKDLDGGCGLAVKAPDCGSGYRGFESRHPPCIVETRPIPGLFLSTAARSPDDQHLERPGTVDSLDPAELDVGGGRRARDPGLRTPGDRGRLAERGDGL